jgi:hypothetical protein
LRFLVYINSIIWNKRWKWYENLHREKNRRGSGMIDFRHLGAFLRMWGAGEGSNKNNAWGQHTVNIISNWSTGYITHKWNFCIDVLWSLRWVQLGKFENLTQATVFELELTGWACQTSKFPGGLKLKKKNKKTQRSIHSRLIENIEHREGQIAFNRGWPHRRVVLAECITDCDWLCGKIEEK